LAFTCLRQCERIAMTAVVEEEFAGRYEAISQIVGDHLNGLAVVRDRTTDELRVRKTLCTADLPKQTAKILRREAEFLQILDHPCIVRLHEHAEKEERLVLILEHLAGGDCSSYLQKAGGALSEVCAASLTRQLLEALSHCHAQGVVHRDVNPSNVAISECQAGQSQQSPVCKLIDFGFAGYCTNGELRDVIGTAAYQAPELRKSTPSYDGKVDVWSAGAFAFELLIGAPPFGKPSDYGGNEMCIYKRVKKYAARDNSEAEFQEVPRWQQLTPDARSFLLWLLSANPQHRPSAAQAAAHPWLQQDRA